MASCQAVAVKHVKKLLRCPSFGNKSSLGDLENISLADNANINEELYNNALNISNKKNNNNINKQMKRNKSGKNLKAKDNVGILDFN